MSLKSVHNMFRTV